MANCLEIEPYMFEPVCQSDESESNDSHADTGSDSDTDGDIYRGRAHQPVQLWCECAKCGPMPRDKECVCCQAWVDTLAEKLDSLICIVDHPDFHTVCLHQAT